MDSRSITRNARHRGAALHPDQSNEPAHLRTPALLCPFSCSSPALHPHPAEDFLSQAQIYFSLPFISTLKHAFNKMLEILTAKAVSKVCWFCLHKIRRTALPTQPHAAAPAQGLLISTRLQHILDLDRGILPCWYSPRKLRRKVLLLASTSIHILLHHCFSTKPAIRLQIQGPSHPFLTTTSQSWQEELSPSLLQAAHTIHKRSKSTSLRAFSHSKPFQKASRKQLSLCKNTFKDAWRHLQEPSASSYFRFPLMGPTDMVAHATHTAMPKNSPNHLSFAISFGHQQSYLWAIRSDTVFSMQGL